MTGQRLVVDWTRCDGHELCAELLPEEVGLDDWGYPVVYRRQDLPAPLLPYARDAVRACPALALRLVERTP